jgi:hypothetical protein
MHIPSSHFHQLTTMTSAISLENIPTAQNQRDMCQGCFVTHIRHCTFDKTEIAFLSPSAIDNLATRANIEAYREKDSVLCQAHRTKHQRQVIINRIFERDRKCFVNALLTKLSMGFLHALMEFVSDDDLPLRNDFVMPMAFRSDYWTFISTQFLVCAPILCVEEYDQVVPFLKCLLITSAERKESDESIYKVTFDIAHIATIVRPPSELDIIARWTGSPDFFHQVFDNKEMAGRHANW